MIKTEKVFLFICLLLIPDHSQSSNNFGNICVSDNSNFSFMHVSGGSPINFDSINWLAAFVFCMGLFTLCLFYKTTNTRFSDNNSNTQVPSFQLQNTIVKKTWDLSNQQIDTVTISGIGTLMIHQLTGNEKEKCSIVAADNLLSYLICTTSNRCLTIRPKANVNFPANSIITYYIKIKELKQLSSSGNIEVKSIEPINTQSLSLNVKNGSKAMIFSVLAKKLMVECNDNSTISLDGAAEKIMLSAHNSGIMNINVYTDHCNATLFNSSCINLTGIASYQDVKCSNSATYNALNCDSNIVNVTATNASHATISPAQSLQYKASNSSHILINGNPINGITGSCKNASIMRRLTN